MDMVAADVITEEASNLAKIYTMVNKKEWEWYMTPQTVNAYCSASSNDINLRAGCVVKKYSNFKMTFNGTSMCINGNPTLGENLVDLGGIELAFRALQQNFADRGASPRLVQELSGNLLFFVVFNQGWCGSVRDVELAMQRLS
jgi:predicted metalloendopeptidase